jgi:hypothetical protein
MAEPYDRAVWRSSKGKSQGVARKGRPVVSDRVCFEREMAWLTYE